MALAPGLVEQDARGDADVQRIDLSAERYRDRGVARLADERPQPATFGTEDERRAAAEVRRPHRRLRIADRRPDPEVVALDLAEVAREVRHHGDRQVLDGARRRPRN